MRYLFRELTTRQELLHYFKLRYEVYHDSNVKKFLSESAKNLDYDKYDLQSTHFGLFIQQGGKWELIGGVRNIDTFFHADKYRQLNHLFRGECPKKVQPLPMMLKVEAGLPNDLTITGAVCEGSRLALRKAYRNIHTGKFLILNAMTILINRQDNPHNLVGTTTGFHSRLYQRYGYGKLNEEPIFMNGVKSDILIISKDTITKGYIPIINSYALNMRTNGYTELMVGIDSERLTSRA